MRDKNEDYNYQPDYGIYDKEFNSEAHEQEYVPTKDELIYLHTLRNKKTKGLILTLVGFAFATIALIVLFHPLGSSAELTPKYSTDVHMAGIYTTDTISWMTDSFAVFADKEDRCFYLAQCENDGEPHLLVICIPDSQISQYLPYIEYAYNAEAPEPEPLTVTGYSEMINNNLMPFVKDGFEYYYGFKLTDEIFGDYILPIYLVVGNANNELENANAVLYLIIFAVLFMAPGIWMFLQKPHFRNTNGHIGTLEPQGSLPLGVLGALIGSIPGCMIVALCVSMFPALVSLCFGAMTFFLTAKGYNALCKKRTYAEAIISTIISAIASVAGCFMSLVWGAFSRLNASGMGFVTFSDAAVYAFDHLPTDESLNDPRIAILSCLGAPIISGIGLIFWIRHDRKLSSQEPDKTNTFTIYPF